jgi:hypothetical protein
MKEVVTQLTQLFKKYPHRFTTIFFVLGFAWDALTLWKADGWYENAWFGLYLIISTVVLVALSKIDEHKTHPRRALLIATLQFCFGALAGGMLILYGRSGTLAGSAAFLSVGAAILLSNDLWAHRYSAQNMRIGVWYALLIAYTSMVFPILYGRIGGDVFMHAILTGFIIAFVLIVAFRAVGYLARPRDLYTPLITISLITVFYIFSHFTRIMPAVPLALRHAGIAHAVSHVDTQYKVQFEESRFPLLLETSNVFNATTPARLFCFSQVYVPKTITTQIQHRWEYFDAVAGAWKTLAIIPYSISGGREAGYRGYTYITARAYGDYRCNIETDDQVLIGRRDVRVRAGAATLKEASF